MQHPFGDGGGPPGPSAPFGNFGAELDPLDVDGLLNYFSQPGAHLDFGNPGFNLNMSAQVPFRDAPAGLIDNPANLFSSIIFPDPVLNAGVPGLAAPAPMPEPIVQARHDSGDSTMEDEAGGSGSGSGATRRGGGGGDKKLSAIQEKNRRAQKRFRERQKAKMTDMTSQLDDMTSELGKLRTENNALKNRNSILEKVLALRDEHIRVLQDEQHVFDLGSHYLQHAAIGAAPAQKLLGPAGVDISGGAPGDSTALALTGGAGVSNGTGPASASSLALALTDINAVKTMPAEAIINHWKDLVRELGNLLVGVEAHPDPADPRHRTAMDALCRALDNAGEVCMLTGVLHPTNMQRLIATTLDDGRSGAKADDKARWASVAHALALAENQQRQLVALRHIFVRREAKVMDERRRILRKLQAVAIPDRMVALQSVISETLKVNEATVALKANLQEEHLCGMEFIGTVFKTILTPMQKARAIVQSYPFYPDVFEIATAVATDRGELAPPVALDGPFGGAPVAGDQVPALLEVPSAYRIGAE